MALILVLKLWWMVSRGTGHQQGISMKVLHFIMRVNTWPSTHSTAVLLRRISVALVVCCFIITQVALPAISSAEPMSSEDIKALNQWTNWVASVCGSTGDTTGTDMSINNQAAKQVARSSGKATVGYALYDRDGKLLANFNENSENYGASITKSMILVAYLNQVGAGSLESSAKSSLTQMIENSDNNAANDIYSLLDSPTGQINDVAQKAGMNGFKINTSDPVYVLGQSQITANDFAKFFSKLDALLPPSKKDFALNLLANVQPKAGLLQANLPGIIYSKEGWKAEPDKTNPFGVEGAPYVVNQAAQFSSGNTKYGIAVTVAGTDNESSGENIVKNVVSALVSPGGSSSQLGGGCACEASSTSLTGKDNEEKIWNYFKSKQLSDEQVAGIMGNIQQESGFDPEIIQGGGRSKDPRDAGSGGWGLIQWTPGEKVIDEAKEAGVDGPIYELASQLDLIWQHMHNNPVVTQPFDLNHFKAISNEVEAAQYFGSQIEGFGTEGARLQYATELLHKHGGTTSGTQISADGGCASTGSPDCQTATGSAKILCEAKKYDPVDYVWGGGHAGGSAYHKACPTIKSNDSSCGLDCSGLVSVAVYDAFNGSGSVSWDTNALRADSTHWKEVSFDKLQPGDVIEPDPDHVEIIDHVAGQTIHTFGAHSSSYPQPRQVGPSQYSNSPNNRYYHYIGPGSS
jgi:beta-lactamase class A